MARMLILFAHPALEKSRVHRRLLRQLPDLPDLTFHDLYEAYPDFAIDVEHEQTLLTQHDLIIFQHPFYWYSTPPIIKQWTDLVLSHGWAYGSQGDALKDKYWLQLISTGAHEEAYLSNPLNPFTVRDLLAPIEQTARLCKMQFLPPYIIYGSHRMNESDIEIAAGQYHQALTLLQADRLDLAAATREAYLNPLIERALSREVPA